MRKRSAKEEELYLALAPLLQEAPCSLIDVRLTKESGKRFLRCYIDRRGGVRIQDCELANGLLEPVVDERFPDLDLDYFEVSSSGIDRPLETALDFELHRGELVEVKLYQKLDGRKVLSGRLGAVEGDQLILERSEGNLTLARQLIAQVARPISFEHSLAEARDLDEFEVELEDEAE